MNNLLKAVSIFSLLVIITLSSSALASPEIPGAEQAKPIALVGATIHPVSGPPIVGGAIVFEKGKIVAVGKDVKIPQEARRIDLKGKHVYPSLFDSYSNMGLVEINAVRATRDSGEAGNINPNVRSQAAVNPDSELIPVTRSNGVLLSLSAPNSSLIAGRSAVLQLDGWTWEDMTLRGDVGLHITWPRMSPVSRWWVEKPPKDQAKQRDEALQTLQDTFTIARAYRKARRADPENHPLDIRWEAMLPVLEGKTPLIVSADETQQIQSAIAFAEWQKVKLIIYGGYDAPHCASLLLKHDVPIIIGGVYRLPQRRDDDYDAAYTLPERLRSLGVKFCIAGAGRFGASNIRNLPYHAATAVAYGLPQEEALRAITLYPAQILGVANRVGSLETGKDATLFITDGDPLETATQVEAAFVQGRRVDLSDRHKRLWRKYQEKYRRMGEN